MRIPRLTPRRRNTEQRDASLGNSPKATRLRSRRWGDLRLWVGMALIVASMFAGARLLSQGTDSVTVWQAQRDLSVGSQNVQLRPVTVSLGSVEGDYLPATEQPVGALRFPIREGELIPRSAFGSPEVGPTRMVTVGVDPMHAPVGLQPGDIVDVWSTPAADASVGETGRAVEPVLVLSNVSVDHVADDAMGISGQFAVVLRVHPREVAELVRAARIGAVDLITVPVDSQYDDDSSAAGTGLTAAQ